MKIDMSDKLMVSMILPSYNVGQYIEDCIESVLGQTMKSVELICVDAGSTDGTLEILEKYSQKNSNIKLILCDRKSYGYQVNIGIKQARGKYVCIVETDDYVEKELCERLVATAEKTEADVVKCNFTMLKKYCNGYIQGFKVLQFGNDKSKYCKMINEKSNHEILLNDTRIWSGLYSTEFIKKNNIILHETPKAAYQDIGFMIQVMDSAERIVYIEDCLYNYRVERDGSSSVNANVLSFVKSEFDWIINDIFSCREVTDDIWRVVFSRLTACFIGELERLVRGGKEASALCEYDWFLEKIKYGIDKGYISESSRCWNRTGDMENVVRGCEPYVDFLRNNIQVINVDDERPLVLFGIGCYGKAAIEILNYQGVLPDLIIDNADEKMGTDYIGIPIDKPRYGVDKYSNALFLIAKKEGAEELEQQLSELGVSDIQMVRFIPGS